MNPLISDKERFALRALKEVFPDPSRFTDFLRKAIISHLPKERWNPKTVKKFIMECRTEENGIPLFKTKFADKEFESEGKPAVLAVCWGGKELPKTTSRLFVDIPPETHKNLEERLGDWKFLIGKYGTESEKKLAYESPIITRRFVI